MLNIPLAPLGRAAAVALALAAGAAGADPPQARAAQEAAARTYRDWRIECGRGVCSIATRLRGGDGSEVLAITASGRGDAGALALRTPLPLFLPDALTLGLGDAEPRGIAWRTCDPTGCTAEAPLDAGLLAALQRERAADVGLTLVDGVRVRLQVSLLGFTAAWEALNATAEVSPP